MENYTKAAKWPPTPVIEYFHTPPSLVRDALAQHPGKQLIIIAASNSIARAWAHLHNVPDSDWVFIDNLHQQEPRYRSPYVWLKSSTAMNKEREEQYKGEARSRDLVALLPAYAYDMGGPSLKMKIEPVLVEDEDEDDELDVPEYAPEQVAIAWRVEGPGFAIAAGAGLHNNMQVGDTFWLVDKTGIYLFAVDKIRYQYDPVHVHPQRETTMRLLEADTVTLNYEEPLPTHAAYGGNEI